MNVLQAQNQTTHSYIPPKNIETQQPSTRSTSSSTVCSSPFVSPCSHQQYFIQSPSYTEVDKPHSGFSTYYRHNRHNYHRVSATSLKHTMYSPNCGQQFVISNENVYKMFSFFCVINKKNWFLTWIYSFNVVISALHTSGTILDISCFDILKVYIKLV